LHFSPEYNNKPNQTKPMEKIKTDAATAMDAFRVAMNAIIDLADTLWDNDAEELGEYANEAAISLSKAGEIIANIQAGI
jgi:hypothetical protein